MNIIGFDTSLNGCGIAIVDTITNKIKYQKKIIHPKDTSERQKRINIQNEITTLLKNYTIDYAVLEDTFMQNNVKTMKQIDVVRGLIIALLNINNINYDETITPNAAKSACGVKAGKDANGDKIDTKALVMDAMYKLFPDLPAGVPNDVTDALALINWYLTEGQKPKKEKKKTKKRSKK